MKTTAHRYSRCQARLGLGVRCAAIYGAAVGGDTCAFVRHGASVFTSTCGARPTLLGDIACLVVVDGWCLSALSSYRPVSMLAAGRHAEIVPGRARPQRRRNVALQITSWFDRGCCRPAIRPLDG